MQLTFGDAEGLGKRKQTRREIFLAEMERIVPWKQLLALIVPHYPVSGRPGRQPYALATIQLQPDSVTDASLISLRYSSYALRRQNDRCAGGWAAT
ncbi:hypothetical protein ADT25_07790 [Xanthomonas oryzae]|uniref:Transposase n=1 Tax=Xanthomonas oryzae TaxID=347 RepID=A0AAP1F089_9XANT|nr:hypothetical protein ADT25_07790 [Xanthomonas oryzae]